MKRKTFALRAHTGMRDKVEAGLRARSSEIQNVIAQEEIKNFSI